MAAPAPAPDATRLGLNQATAGSKGRVKRKSLPKRDGPIWKSVTVLVRKAGPSYAGLGSGLVGEGSSELGSELQNCWVAFEHAGDGGCFFGEPSEGPSGCPPPPSLG